MGNRRQARENVSPLEALEQAGGVEPETIRLMDVIVDDAVQCRVSGLNEDTVGAYVAVLENDGTLPPITVFRQGDSDKYILAAGFHRVEAHYRVHREMVQAFVHAGDMQAAMDYAEQDNLQNGLQLTNQDKKNILWRRLGRGHEWAVWSSNSLAKQLGVTHPTVSAWRKEWELQNQEHLKEFSSDTPTPQTRVTADGRRMDVSNIGKNTPPKRVEESYTLPDEIVVRDGDDWGEGYEDDYGDYQPPLSRGIHGDVPQPKVVTHDPDQDVQYTPETGYRRKLAVEGPSYAIMQGIQRLMENNSVAAVEALDMDERQDLMASLEKCMIKVADLWLQIAAMGGDMQFDDDRLRAITNSIDEMGMYW